MSQLLIARDGRVLRLTLNRAEENNLLNEGLCRDLVSTLKEAGRDRGVGCVLLEAAGPLFCGGLDLEEGLASDADYLIDIHEDLFTFGLHYHKPLVAAVQGPCLGAGVGLIANAHLVVAAQGVQFGLTEIRQGFWPFVTHRALSLAMGERRTVELSLTGRIFSVQEASQYGLVHEITPAFELGDRATAIAERLATCSQETMRRGLDFVQQSREMSWATAGILAVEMTGRTQRSADFREGVHAARESRKPEWPSLNRG